MRILLKIYRVPKISSDMESFQKRATKPKNVLGTELEPCSMGRPNPKGLVQSVMRDGYCYIPQEEDVPWSKITVCAEMTKEFLEFSKQHGTDFTSPDPHYDFPGVTAGDKWCICARKWAFAMTMNKARSIKLESSHISLLKVLDLEDLKRYCSS